MISIQLLCVWFSSYENRLKANIDLVARLNQINNKIWKHLKGRSTQLSRKKSHDFSQHVDNVELEEVRVRRQCADQIGRNRIVMNSSTKENEAVPDCMCERNDSIAFEKSNTQDEDQTTEGQLRDTIVIRLKWTTECQYLIDSIELSYHIKNYQSRENTHPHVATYF